MGCFEIAIMLAVGSLVITIIQAIARLNITDPIDIGPVKEIQKEHDILTDGIMGPQTRAILRDANFSTTKADNTNSLIAYQESSIRYPTFVGTCPPVDPSVGDMYFDIHENIMRIFMDDGTFYELGVTEEEPVPSSKPIVKVTKCPECGAPVDRNLEVCPYCGVPYPFE